MSGAAAGTSGRPTILYTCHPTDTVRAPYRDEHVSTPLTSTPLTYKLHVAGEVGRLWNPARQESLASVADFGITLHSQYFISAQARVPYTNAPGQAPLQHTVDNCNERAAAAASGRDAPHAAGRECRRTPPDAPRLGQARLAARRQRARRRPDTTAAPPSQNRRGAHRYLGASCGAVCPT